MSVSCIFCSRSFPIKGLNAHSWTCKKNPNRRDRLVRSNSFLKAKEEGREFHISDETRNKLSNASRKHQWSNERKLNHSKAMQKTVKENPDSYSKNNVCGRVKTVEYSDGVNLKGSWEVRVAEWLDAQNIRWENEANPQSYFWNDKWHLYFPDFYLPEYECYIEVKGYRTDRDIAKWNYFKGDLLIFEKEVVDKLDDLSVQCVLEKFKWDCSSTG